MPMWRLRKQREQPRQLRTSSYPPCEPVPPTKRLSAFHRTFTLLNDSGIATGSGSFSAFCSHSAFSFGANAESDAADDHPDPRCRTFLNDPAPLRSRLLNDVVVRKGGRNDESCQGSTSQNCSHWEILHVSFLSPKRGPRSRAVVTAGLSGAPFMCQREVKPRAPAKQTHGRARGSRKTATRIRSVPEILFIEGFWGHLYRSGAIGGGE